MCPQQRRGILAVALATFAGVVLLTAWLQAGQPQSSPVVVAKLTSFSGTSEKGSLEEALEAAVEHATAVAPAGRQTVWKVIKISGLSGGAKPPHRVIVTVEAHW